MLLKQANDAIQMELQPQNVEKEVQKRGIYCPPSCVNCREEGQPCCSDIECKWGKMCQFNSRYQYGECGNNFNNFNW